MKKNSSRRSFLKKTTLISTGIVVLSSTNIVNAFNNHPCPYNGYNPYISINSDLRVSPFSGRFLNLQGQIFNKSGINPLSNVTVEVWHLASNSTKKYQRGKVNTNKYGEYFFKTEYLICNEGKISKIYFKISDAKKTYFTQIILEKTGANIMAQHWKNNHQLEDRLFPELIENSKSSSITFNMTL